MTVNRTNRREYEDPAIVSIGGEKDQATEQ